MVIDLVNESVSVHKTYTVNERVFVHKTYTVNESVSLFTEIFVAYCIEKSWVKSTETLINLLCIYELIYFCYRHCRLWPLIHASFFFFCTWTQILCSHNGLLLHAKFDHSGIKVYIKVSETKKQTNKKHENSSLN